MQRNFEDISVSIVLLLPETLRYPLDSWRDGLKSCLAQDHPHTEVVIVDGRGPNAGLDLVTDDGNRVLHLPNQYGSRAAMYNAGLEAATGDYTLLVYCDQSAVVLRRSAVRAFVMAAARQHAPSFVYADYELIDADGSGHERHLLDWHEGRLRDTTDFGRAILCPTALLRELGGFNERYDSADLYDLRLRLTERGAPAHIANRYAGSLYSVFAPRKDHNVFDYLLDNQQAQREAEDALTQHLRRIGTLLKPGRHVRPVEYTPDEAIGPADCLASVIIPVHRRPEFIGQAIESVQAQTVSRVEVIVVVNGGPEDPTIEAVRPYLPDGDRHRPDAPPVRLLVLDVNNLGVCFNTGLQIARGRYYVQLDSDDRLKPDAVEKLLAVFDADPTVGMVIGSYEVWDLDESTGRLTRNDSIPVVTHDEWTADNGRNNLLRINGAGAPRAAHIKVIRDVGWFGINDEPYSRNYGEDYDLVLRISERYTVGRVWEPIYEVIRHRGGTDHSIDQATVDRNDEAKDQMRRAALHRRRALNTAAQD